MAIYKLLLKYYKMFIFSPDKSFLYSFGCCFFALDVPFTHSEDSLGLSCGWNAQTLCGLRKFALAQTESLRGIRSLWVTFVSDVIVIISAIKTFSSPLTFTPLKETGTDTVYTIRAISYPVTISTVILWAPITPYRLLRRTHNYLFVYFNKEASECSSLKHTCTHSNTRK